MEGVKSILESKTIWGGLVALVAGVVGIWGYSISPEDQTSLVALVTGIPSLVGGAFAIYGRIVASKQVTITGK